MTTHHRQRYHYAVLLSMSGAAVIFQELSGAGLASYCSAFDASCDQYRFWRLKWFKSRAHASSTPVGRVLTQSYSTLGSAGPSTNDGLDNVPFVVQQWNSSPGTANPWFIIKQEELDQMGRWMVSRNDDADDNYTDYYGYVYGLSTGTESSTTFLYEGEFEAEFSEPLDPATISAAALRRAVRRGQATMVGPDEVEFMLPQRPAHEGDAPAKNEAVRISAVAGCTPPGCDVGQAPRSKLKFATRL